MSRAKIPKSSPDEFEAKFHQLLGRLVHETARFDFIVGLQLNYLSRLCAMNVEKYLDPKRHNLNARLGVLRRVVNRVFKNASPEARRELSTWFKSADAARAMRNNYAHGRWGVPGRLAEVPGNPALKEPQLAFVALDWDMSPERGDRSIYLTMDDFQSQVEEAISVFNSFFSLVDRHLAATPSAWPNATVQQAS